MKKNYFFISIATISLLFIPTAYSMDSSNTENTYRGEQITPETLVKLAPEIPVSLADSVEFVKENKTLLRTLASFPSPIEMYKDKLAQDKALMRSAGLENQGNGNYIFRIPPGTYIQISGLGNIIPGLKNTSNLPPHYVEEDFIGTGNDRRLSPALFEKLRVIPTYQTVSRVANYLRLQETLEAKGLSLIKTMPTYMVHIPEQPVVVCDENYIVLQPEARGIYQVDAYPEKLKLVHDKAIVEMFTAITESGALWDLGSNLHITQEGEFFVTDLEQPNYSNPELFYYKDGRTGCEFRHSVCCGIMGLNGHLKKHAPHLLGILKMLVTGHPDLNNRDNHKYPEYKANIIDT